MLNPLMLLGLLGGGAYLLAKKTTTPAYIPPPTPYGGPTNLTNPIVMPPLVVTPSGPQPIAQSQIPSVVKDSIKWEVTGWSASSGYTTLVDPLGNNYAVGPTKSKSNSMGGIDYYLDDGRIVRNPSKSPFYTEQSGTGDTPWSSSSTPDQTGPSAATPLSIPQLPTQLSQLPGFITSTLPGLLQQASSFGQPAASQTPGISYQPSSSGPQPTAQNQIPTLPMLPAGFPSIANLSSSQLRGVATQVSALGQAAIAQQLNNYADMMDSTGQKTVYVTPNPNAPVTSNW